MSLRARECVHPLVCRGGAVTTPGLELSSFAPRSVSPPPSSYPNASSSPPPPLPRHHNPLPPTHPPPPRRPPSPRQWTSQVDPHIYARFMRKLASALTWDGRLRFHLPHYASPVDVVEAKLRALRGVLRLADPIFTLRRDTLLEPSRGATDHRLSTFLASGKRRSTFVGYMVNVRRQLQVRARRAAVAKPRPPPAVAAAPVAPPPPRPKPTPMVPIRKVRSRLCWAASHPLGWTRTSARLHARMHACTYARMRACLGCGHGRTARIAVRLPTGCHTTTHHIVLGQRMPRIPPAAPRHLHPTAPPHRPQPRRWPHHFITSAGRWGWTSWGPCQRWPAAAWSCFRSECAPGPLPRRLEPTSPLRLLVGHGRVEMLRRR